MLPYDIMVMLTLSLHFKLYQITHTCYNMVFLVLCIDVLSLKKIQEICDVLLKKSNSSVLINICKRLNAACYEHKDGSEPRDPMTLTQFSMKHKSLKEVLFHVIYSWHCFNPVSSTVTLAKFLMKSGYYNEAFVINPLCKLLKF